MLSDKILSIYKQIFTEAYNMVVVHVDMHDLTGNVNYASIYAQSENEYVEFLKELETNGSVFDIQPTGNYYALDNPFKVSIGKVTRCRVRKPDAMHKERGYIDFEPKNYQVFKNKYLSKQYFSEIQNVHGIELIELHDPKYNARVFFPSTF